MFLANEKAFLGEKKVLKNRGFWYHFDYQLTVLIATSCLF